MILRCFISHSADLYFWKIFSQHVFYDGACMDDRRRRETLAASLSEQGNGCTGVRFERLEQTHFYDGMIDDSRMNS